jgi:hypothetical protein
MDSITERPPSSNGTGEKREVSQDFSDMKRALLAGLLGAVVASAGYLIYTKLEEEQKQAVRSTVSKFVEDKVGEFRSQFKI